MDLVTKFSKHVDEAFAAESRSSLLARANFDFVGANQVAIWTTTSGEMQDYLRNDETGEGGREVLDELNAGRSLYGTIGRNEATAHLYNLQKDRSFTFMVDALDLDETAGVLAAGGALARQVRERIIPEIDSYVVNKMISGAGTTAEAAELTAANIYTKIISANSALDEAEVPEADRVLLVTPATMLLMKQCEDIVMETDIAENMRIRGVISNLDGLRVIKIPSSRVPETFGFLIAHPDCTAAPEKLRSFNVHTNPPGLNGTLIEGRINYGCFVLPNKANGIYYQPIPES